MNENIVMIAQSRYSRDNRVRRYAEALVEAGNYVDVISLVDNDEANIYSLNNVMVHQVPIYRQKRSALRYVWECFAFLLFAFFKLTRLYFKKRYSVVHVHNMPNFLVFSAIIPKLFGAKIILDIHDPFPELSEIKFGVSKNSFPGKILALEEKLSISFADHILTPTEMVKRNLLRKGYAEEKVSVVVNIADSKIFDPGLVNEHPRIGHDVFFRFLFAGTVSRRNGLHNVFEALLLLKDKIPGIRYRIVGRGDYLEELQRTVAASEAPELVEFVSSRTMEEIPAEILASDAIAWFPERNNFIDLALSVKVMEALNMGKPVLSVSTECHEYYFDEGEVLFTASSNPSEIASAILNLYRNYQELQPTAEDTRRFIAKFNLEKEMAGYFRLITDLLQIEAPQQGVEEKQIPEEFFEI